MVHFVYETTNLVNGMTYSGIHSTDNINEFDGYFGSGKIIKQAINKYGKENFKRKILAICPSREFAAAVERGMVTEEAIQRKDNYNLVVGGGYPPVGSHAGHKHTEETKEILRQKNRGYIPTDETRKRISDALSNGKHFRYGKKLPEEHVKNMFGPRQSLQRGKNPFAKRIEILGQEFDCCRDASEYLGVAKTTITRWLKNGTNGAKEI